MPTECSGAYRCPACSMQSKTVQKNYYHPWQWPYVMRSVCAVMSLFDRKEGKCCEKAEENRRVWYIATRICCDSDKKKRNSSISNSRLQHIKYHNRVRENPKVLLVKVEYNCRKLKIRTVQAIRRSLKNAFLICKWPNNSHQLTAHIMINVSTNMLYKAAILLCT